MLQTLVVPYARVQQGGLIRDGNKMRARGRLLSGHLRLARTCALAFNQRSLALTYSNTACARPAVAARRPRPHVRCICRSARPLDLGPKARGGLTAPRFKTSHPGVTASPLWQPQVPGALVNCGTPMPPDKPRPGGMHMLHLYESIVSVSMERRVHHSRS